MTAAELIPAGSSSYYFSAAAAVVITAVVSAVDAAKHPYSADRASGKDCTSLQSFSMYYSHTIPHIVLISYNVMDSLCIPSKHADLRQGMPEQEQIIWNIAGIC